MLQMIAQTPAERAMYEARLKFETDQAWKIQEALKEGRQEGKQEGWQEGLNEGRQEGLAQGMAAGVERGKYLGQIPFLQNLLGLAESPSTALETLEIPQLQQLLADLQAQLRDRR
ncbi:MAG: hypothetical protein JSS02_13555 [Planctomycetes bacterium]|nr:hypothetical protein [Planctomycetota bacterium]